VYNALFISPISDFYDNDSGHFSSDIDLDDLIEKTEFTEKVIIKSLKGLIKKNLIEYSHDCQSLTLNLKPDLN